MFKEVMMEVMLSFTFKTCSRLEPTFRVYMSVATHTFRNIKLRLYTPP
jgi:hypothetical protein